MLAGMEKKSNVLSPAERRIVAYHEAGHTLVGWLLQHTDPILKVSAAQAVRVFQCTLSHAKQVTIVPRTKGILGFTQYLPSEQRLFSREQVSLCQPERGRGRRRGRGRESESAVSLPLQLFDRMCVLLGGRLAEAVTFKKISTGPAPSPAPSLSHTASPNRCNG